MYSVHNTNEFHLVYVQKLISPKLMAEMRNA